MTAGLVVNVAFNDWFHNPIITSVDSIAAPIDLIQFPTITVCHEESRQPDNWAFLETILNNQPLECIMYERYSYPYHSYCNDTEKIRQDFKFIFKELVEELKNWLFNKEIFDSDILNEYHYSEIHYCTEKNSSKITFLNPVNGIANKVCELVANKAISINQLAKLPIDYFAKKVSFTDVLDLHWGKNFTSFLLDGHGNECSSEECKNDLIPVLMRLLVEVTELDVGMFGNFLSYFLSKVKLDKRVMRNTFKNGKNLNNIWSDICLIGQNEEFLQRYFTNLSKLIGLEGKEAVSLYDIPSMLSNANEDSIHTFQHNFLYSRCKDNNNVEMNTNPSYLCFAAWKELFKTGICRSSKEKGKFEFVYF